MSGQRDGAADPRPGGDRMRHRRHRLGELGPAALARSAFRKEAHTTMLYVVLSVAAAATAVADRPEAALLFSFVLVPVILSVVSAKDFAQESRLAEERFTIERRAEEVLTQDQLA